MSTREKRQHIRIDDQIYFDYKIIDTNRPQSSNEIMDELLGKNGEKYLEINQQFQGIEKELSYLTQILALKDPVIADCINLISTKIDCLAQNTLMNDKLYQRSVDLSLGGMAFKTSHKIEVGANIKLVIYTRPHLVPIFIDCTVAYSQFVNDRNYRTAVQFEHLTLTQEKLLTQHMMQSQTHFNPC